VQPSLSAAYKDLAGAVGFFLGFGRGADNGDPAWDARQEASIKECVKSGLRNFYHCGYDWSFLKPVASFTLAQGASEVPLPLDFAGLEGPITVSTAGSAAGTTVSVAGDVRHLYALNPDATGRPLAAAIDPLKGTGQHQGQRFRLHLYPAADQAYTLEFAYYLNPDFLSGDRPYAYGGPQHAETLLASCQAVAELNLDDARGVRWQYFQERLAVSMDIDRRNKPQNLGYNGDRSDHKGRARRRHNPDGYTVTFNGVEYD